MIGNHESSLWDPLFDPQGLVLSLVLLNVKRKLMSKIIRICGAECHQYAEGTQFYLSLTRHPGAAVSMLNCYLQSVVKWMRGNKLKLNSERIVNIAIQGGIHLLVLDGDCSYLA